VPRDLRDRLELMPDFLRSDDDVVGEVEEGGDVDMGGVWVSTGDVEGEGDLRPEEDAAPPPPGEMAMDELAWLLTLIVVVVVVVVVVVDEEGEVFLLAEDCIEDEDGAKDV